MNDIPRIAARTSSTVWGLPSISGDAHLDPDLRERFDEWFSGSGSLLLEAPHGYGKTTQLALWLQEIAPSTAVVWISENPFVGTWDAARATLLHALSHLGLIAEGVDPHDMPSVYLALKSLETTVVLVHDDYDRLAPAHSLAQLEEVAREFPRLRNIYASSAIGTEERPATDPELVVITHRDLSWSSDFAARVLGANIGDARAAHRLEDVVETTGGRASAIIEYYRSRPRLGRSRDSVAEFHARWLLERATLADPSGQGAVLLLDLAQFIELPLHLLGEFGHPDAGSLVAALAREGLVAIGRSAYGGTSVVSVPERTRRSLLARSNAVLGAVLDDLHQRAAAVFDRQRCYPLAAYHLARSGSHQQAIAQLMKPISIDDRGEGLLISRAVFQEIPLELLEKVPEALAMRVISAHSVPTEPIQSRGDAELRLLSYPSETIAGLSVRSRALIATAMVAALLGRNRAAEAVARGRAVAGDLDGLGWDEVRGLGRIPGLLWTTLAEAELVNCNVRRAIDLAAAASDWNAELGHPIAILRSLAVRAAANAIEGDIEKARRYIGDAELAIAFHELSAASAPLTLTIARFYVALAELDAAGMRSVAAVVRRHSPGEAPWSGFGAAAEAYALLFSGRVMDAFAASRLVLRAAESRSTPLLVRHMILGVHSDSLLAAGRPGEALSLLEPVVESAGHPFCYASRKAAAALAMGDAVRAVRLTEECLELGSKHIGGTLAAALVRRAAAHESLQMHAAADASFASGMALLTRKTCAFTFLNLSPSLLVPLWTRLGISDPLLLAQTVSLADPWEAIRGALPTATAPISIPPERLSDREREVLTYLYERRTYRQIGDLMFLSENTVKTHVSHIYKKLRTTSRKEAIDLALQLGLINPRGDG